MKNEDRLHRILKMIDEGEASAREDYNKKYNEFKNSEKMYERAGILVDLAAGRFAQQQNEQAIDAQCIHDEIHNLENEVKQLLGDGS